MAKAVVIGGGLGGLSAAIHLAYQGLEVEVLEQNARTGGRANQLQLGGFTFDTGPSLLNYPWVYDQLFSMVNERFRERVDLVEVEPGIRFNWPDGEQLQLSSQFDRLRAEFERYDPGVGPRLSAWLAQAGHNYRLSFERLVTTNADSPLQWLGRLRFSELAGLGLQRSIYSQLQRSFKSKRICQALGSYAMYLGGSPFELPGLFEILPFGEINYGLWLPKGGIYSLVTAVNDLALEQGVRIRTGARVSRINSSGGRASGVVLEDGEQVAADVVISNCDLPTTNTELLPGKGISRGSSRHPLMTPGVVTFYWGLTGRIESLGHHSIYFPDDYPASFKELMRASAISSQPPFYVSLASESDPGLAPPGKSTMFVLVPTPVLSRMQHQDWPDALSRLKCYVISRLQTEGCRISESDIEEEQIWTPEDWRSRFGLYDGSAFGAAHRLMMLGPWRSANASRQLPGLFYVGASTTPGTGMPLVVLGGKMTAERVMQYVR